MNNKPNFAALEDNLCYVIKEQHLKLGYTEKDATGPWLYYPLGALNNVLDTSLNVDEMQELLTEFSKYVEPRLGAATISHKDERFRIQLPAKASKYVHDEVPDEPFLIELIEALSKHGTGIDEILDIFRKHAIDENDLIIEESPSDEFDVLVYFGSGKPDPFLYCLADEMGHVTYHRMTTSDLNDRL